MFSPFTFELHYIGVWFFCAYDSVELKWKPNSSMDFSRNGVPNLIELAIIELGG